MENGPFLFISVSQYLALLLAHGMYSKNIEEINE